MLREKIKTEALNQGFLFSNKQNNGLAYNVSLV